MDFRGLLKELTPEEDAETKRRIVLERRKERMKHIEAQEKYINAPEWWTVQDFKRDKWPAMATLLDNVCCGSSFLVTAPTNSGKSHAVVAMARVLVGKIVNPEAPIEQQRYMTAYRVKEHELYPRWDTSRYKRSEEFDAIVERAKQADVLIYDDLGKVELAHGNGLSYTPFGCVIFSIFDYRAETRKINLVTSRYENLTQLQQAVGVDLIRRVVQAEGDTYRARVIAKSI